MTTTMMWVTERCAPSEEEDKVVVRGGEQELLLFSCFVVEEAHTPLFQPKVVLPVVLVVGSHNATTVVLETLQQLPCVTSCHHGRGLPS